MMGNISLNEFIRSLELSNNPREREIAETLERFDVLNSVEVAEETVDHNTVTFHEVTDTAALISDLTRYLLTEAKWELVENFTYILSGFNEDTHPYHQNVALKRGEDKKWRVIANCGYVYSQNRDKHHGEKEVTLQLRAKASSAAKREAIDVIIEELVSRNLLYRF